MKEAFEFLDGTVYIDFRRQIANEAQLFLITNQQRIFRSIILYFLSCSRIVSITCKFSILLQAVPRV